MKVFGKTPFVFEYFSTILAFASASILWLVFRSRISPIGLGLMILVSTVLLLTRQPLEYLPTSSGPVSTHSFLYNRLGFVALMAAGMFVALPSAKPRAEAVGGALIGSIIAFALLTKPTFAVLLLATLIGLLIQARRRGIIGLLVGVAVVVLLLDPRLAGWRGAVSYLAAQVADDRGAQLDYLVIRAFRIPLAQALATILSLAALAYVFRAREARPALIGVVVVAMAGMAMAVTMGGAPGQLALPIAILLALAAAEWARLARLDFRLPLLGIAIAIPLSFALAHGANLAGATLLSHQKAHLSTIKTGPYSRYVGVRSRNFGEERLKHYDMFADGIAQLNQMGDASRWGIIADMGITFEFALLAKPVTGFPLWQRRHTPEFAAGRPLPAQVDVVMLGRMEVENSLKDILTEKMKNDFRFCKRSEYWTIYVRNKLAAARCPQAEIREGQPDIGS